MKPRSRKVVPWSAIAADQTRLALTDSALSHALGLTTSTVNRWRQSGEAPAWAQVAIEGLVRRARPAEIVLVARVPSQHAETIKTFLDALSIRYTSL